MEALKLVFRGGRARDGWVFFFSFIAFFLFFSGFMAFDWSRFILAVVEDSFVLFLYFYFYFYFFSLLLARSGALCLRHCVEYYERLYYCFFFFRFSISIFIPFFSHRIADERRRSEGKKTEDIEWFRLRDGRGGQGGGGRGLSGVYFYFYIFFFSFSLLSSIFSPFYKSQVPSPKFKSKFEFELAKVYLLFFLFYYVCVPGGGGLVGGR